MARVEFEETGMGQHVDWMLSRVEMAKGMGAFSAAVYTHSQLPLRVREVARYRIAQINGCPVCLATRAEGAEAGGVTEDLYEHLDAWRTDDRYSARERLAVDFAERFATDPASMDDAFWAELKAVFADDEIVDLAICTGMWLGLGRMQAVLGIHPTCEITV